MFIDIIVFFVTGVCLLTDLTKRKIYNFVLLPAVLLAVGYHIYTGGIAGGLFSLKGLLTGAALLIIPYSAGGIGAGDVKLLATIGSLKGSAFIFCAFLAGAVAGGILAIFHLLINKKLAESLKLIFNPFFLPMGIARCDLTGNPEKADKKGTIPYGAAIAMGTLAAYFVR
ncbi:MAG: prepilin peptidase [Peptococcaceae bacterium]|nr:prepilin peptidase [Peptococcaceae bacterium]